MAIEYIIWGKAPGAIHEELLISEEARIASRASAERFADILREVHGCRDLRIQEFSFGNGDEVIAAFASSVA